MSTRPRQPAASGSKATAATKRRESAFVTPSAASTALRESCLALAASLGLETPSQGTLDYIEELEHAFDLHVRKVVGYGTSDDAWANFRRVSQMGISPVVGIIVRLNDKMSRINNLVASGGRADLIGEGLDRELEDMAGYSHIARCMIKEEARVTGY